MVRNSGGSEHWIFRNDFPAPFQISDIGSVTVVVSTALLIENIRFFGMIFLLLVRNLISGSATNVATARLAVSIRFGRKGFFQS